MSVAELVAAVVAQESGRLVKIPGIGKKTAERLLLELKGRLGAEALSGVAVNRPRPVASDVMNALLALGYSDKEAQLAVKHLPEGLSVSDGIRQALKSLAKSRAMQRVCRLIVFCDQTEQLLRFALQRDDGSFESSKDGSRWVLTVRGERTRCLSST